MIQSRTHNCNELRIGNVGERVTLVGWFENMRKVSKNLGFVILRDFYGTTQLVVETEEMMNVMDGINKESTISVEGTVRERDSKTVLFITHDVEEAIFLSGRVLVVEDTPIRRLRSFEVPAPYPRTRACLTEPRKLELRENLISLLRREVSE